MIADYIDNIFISTNQIKHLLLRNGKEKEFGRLLPAKENVLRQTLGKARTHLHTLSVTLTGRLRYRDYHRFSSVLKKIIP
ncbi:Uncharacterised protein [Bergeriella denitrificans]|uniref:Uncharacterized protein n=1 Tax=Bergeriella denitrificans TaxID=494 RepID=A0A378UIU4_BERDE|nr:Uncharacterised protein [Bergeriella denitrificans]